MNVVIYIDNRERSVIPFIDKYADQYHIKYEIKQMSTADYAICVDGKIVFIIERKTWDDLAASMLDGRKNNINKLLSLREKTGCKVSYFIEGEAFPKRESKANRHPYGNLIAHIDHIMFRDDIYVIQTKNEENTALRLCELAKNISTIKGVKNIVNEKYKLEDVQDVQDVQEVQDVQVGLLTEKQKSNINVQELILTRLPSVGSVVATLLVENGITLRSIFKGEHKETDIARLKYLSGASVGVEKAKKIIRSVRNIDAEDEKKYYIKILSSIPGISDKSAAKVLSKTSLFKILSGNISVEDLAKLKKTDKASIGPKAASEIYNYLINPSPLKDQL